MFDILYYVFENYQQAELSRDTEGVARKLSAAGFDEPDIQEALSWLAGVVQSKRVSVAPLPAGNAALRLFASKESAKLDAGCRGFMLFLEQSGVLSPEARELVIDRALATGEGPLSLEQLKLIVLMVLWNSGTPASRLVAEDLVSGRDGRIPS